MSPKKKRVYVYVVSDATGLTAERVIQAVLVQFQKSVDAVVERRAFVQTPDQMAAVLKKAESKNGVVIYSLVDEDLRSWTKRNRNKFRVELIDLIGPIITRMTRRFHVSPLMHPGLLVSPLEETIKLAETIHFTLEHDDGLNPESIGLADLIILGVSKTTKTPTSLYLACNFHLKVANVPIIQNVEPPKKIYTLKRPRMVGLTIQPERLRYMRRMRYEGQDVGDYYDHDFVVQELAYCRDIYSRVPGIRVIDVTNNTIEQTANRILD